MSGMDALASQASPATSPGVAAPHSLPDNSITTRTPLSTTGVEAGGSASTMRDQQLPNRECVESSSKRLPRPRIPAASPQVTVTESLTKRQREERLKELQKMALAMDCVLMPLTRWRMRVGRAVAMSLRTMEGRFIYQSTALRLQSVPLEAARSLFTKLPRMPNASTMEWTFDSFSEVSQAFAPLLALSGHHQTMGISRAIQRASEPVIRVVATMLGGIEVAHVRSAEMETLYINFLYVLTDDHGEVHLPKDSQRRELGFSEAEMTKIRQQVQCLPKIPWKYGILNNASDDAREEIAAQLKTWGHPLDTRRKDDNRCRNQKWFTGEAWNTFCNGQRGSPGGPVAIAEIVSIIAHDVLQRGVDHGCESAGALQVDDDVGATQLDIPQQGEGPEHGGCGRGRGRGGKQGRSKSAFSDRIAAKHSSAAARNESDEERVGNRQEIEHQPTQVEKDADADAVQLVRETFKSRAQTILNALLAFDAYFAWYYPIKCGVSFMCPIAERQRLALHCCRTAIDMHEIFERISARNHGSFLPHGAIFKMPRDILKIGDIEAAGASPLELQNAETKRAASSVGARNISFLERSKGSVNATSMALSTLNHVLAAQSLRRRKGAIALDASRATERLFGVESAGRLTRKWIKPEVDGQYSPRLDTCVKAFARLLIAQQSSSASASTSK